jgi:O-antigen ligase
LAVGTRRVTVTGTDPGPEPTRAGQIVSWAGLLLLVATAAGLLGQGAYYGPVQRFLGLLVAAATVLTLVARPPTGDDVRALPLLPMTALAAWAVLDAVLLGQPAAGAAGVALLLAGVVAVLFVGRRLGPEDRDVLLLGLTGVGLVVALTGWLGVALRIGSLAWEGDGIWRASATLTYPNAAAAVLVPLALVGLARLARGPRSLLMVVAVTGLLAGAAATMSRAGAVALVIGLVVLAALAGPGRVLRVAAGPCAGTLVALAALVPSMFAARQPRPLLAAAGLAAGLALAVVVAVAVAGSGTGRGPALQARVGTRLGLALLAGVVLLGGLGTVAVLGGGSEAYRAVAGARANLASPERTEAVGAAVGVLADHPLGGAGPGHTQLRWEGPDGGTRFFKYAHNEYVQVAADLGLVGLALLAVLLAWLARLLWRARATAAWPWPGVVAACCAFAVHSGFDFVWHLPAVVLTVALLAGVVLPPPPAGRPPIPRTSPDRKEAP